MDNNNQWSLSKVILVWIVYEIILIWLYFIIYPSYVLIGIFAIPPTIFYFKDEGTNGKTGFNLIFNIFIAYFISYAITFFPVKLVLEFINIVN